MEPKANLYSPHDSNSFGSLWLANFGFPVFIDKSAPNSIGETNMNHPNLHNLEENRVAPLHKCNECDFTTHHQGTLESHVKSKHKPKKIYSCDQCEFTTSNRGNLTYHLSKHSGEKPFKCDYCDHRSRSAAYLKIHVRSRHTGEKPYVCKECNFATPHSNALKSHIAAKHTGQKKYKCDMCDYSAVHSGNLKYHINSKHKEKPFKCHLCDYSAGHNGNLKTHIETKHTEDKKFKCPECEYSTGHQGNFKHHLKTSHDIDPSGDYVPQSFSSPSSQESSSPTTSLYPYRCTQCPAFFHYPGKLVSHITEKHNFITENTDLCQTFRCSECTYSTSEEHLLTAHRNEKHSSSHNFPNNCDTDRNSLQTEAFKCPECAFTTPHEESLMAHKADFHPILENFRVKCLVPGCGFVAALKRDLEVHIETSHPLPKIHSTDSNLHKSQTPPKYKNTSSTPPTNQNLTYDIFHPGSGSKSNRSPYFKPFRSVYEYMENTNLIYERNGPNEVYICPPCHQSCSSLEDFQLHLCRRHPCNQPCCFKCEVPSCGLFAMDLENLRTHMRHTHSSTCFFKILPCN